MPFSHANMPAPSSEDAIECIFLPARFDRLHVNALRDAILEVLRQASQGGYPPQLLLQGQEVEFVDTAGIQLLLAAVRSFDSAQGSLCWQGNAVLAAAFEQLGFAGIYSRHHPAEG